jgi:hypothetical protein
VRVQAENPFPAGFAENAIPRSACPSDLSGGDVAGIREFRDNVFVIGPVRSVRLVVHDDELDVLDQSRGDPVGVEGDERRGH